MNNVSLFRRSTLDEESLAQRANAKYESAMGIWGHTPTETDAAIDWLEGLFELTKLDAHVLDTLKGDVHANPDEIRAAAHLVNSLIQADIWPSESRSVVKDQASQQLQRMLDEKVVTNSLMVAEIRKEIRQLGSPPGLTRG